MNPRQLGPVSLWNALDEDEREVAARVVLAAEPSVRPELDRIVARARHLRPQTVRKWADDKIGGAMRTVPLQDPALALLLLHYYIATGPSAMRVNFMDALGVSHKDGQVESIDELDAPEETIRFAAIKMAEEHGPRAAALYLLSMRLSDAPAGEKAAACLRDLCADRVDDPISEVDAVAAPIPDESGGDLSRQRSFTTLDRLLINAAVDTAGGIDGALTEDQLDDAVDEFVKLNGRRHQSYFHAGFRDVLFDKTISDELPGENKQRLRWYWTGAIQGWARRGRWDCIVREYDKNPVVGELGTGRNSPSVAAVRHVVEALRRQDRTVEIARFVKVGALVGQPALFEILLDAATELLRKGDAVNARPIFELLMKTRGALEAQGVSPAQRLLLDAHRRTAHCLRQLHEHARARKLLEDLLADDPDPNIHAMVHADLGLLEGGFDGLEEVALPVRSNELAGVLERLSQGAEHFRESLSAETAYSAHGHYCLGVLALGRAAHDHEFQDAEHHLQRVRVYFSEVGGSYSEDLVRHADLYFGIAKTQQLQSDKLAHAADVMVGALNAGARFPVYLVDQTVDALGLADDKADLRRVTDAIIDTGGDVVLDELAGCRPALDHCPVLAEKLCARAERGKRPASARAADLRAALRGLMHRGDFDRAGGALDGLDRLALDGVAVTEFLELLEDRAGYDPVWTFEDATIARARCHEARGEFGDATSVLRKLFHRLAAQETEAGLDDVGGVLHRIEGYGIDGSFFSDMTDRYSALASRLAADEAGGEAGPASDSERPRVVRVLVVGGAEPQARAEDAVRSALKESHPRIRVRMVQTGWGSNWARKLAEIEGEMKRHDALVIVRFMRTHLGRQVRRCWSGPWRSCWGGGAGAIAEAVVRAAGAVR